METIQELITYYSQNTGYVWEQFYRHFLMSAYGVLFAAIVAIPVGIIIAKHHKLSKWVMSLANIIQTIPALAMLAVLMLVIGFGTTTVVSSLFLNSLLPILKNTYTGIRNVDHALLQSGKAMGMTKFQVLRMVELPLAMSVILAGLRSALVIAIGIATIGTFIGAGGLGDIIIGRTNATDGTAIILAGVIPTALMVVIADVVMAWLEQKISPMKKKKSNTGLQVEKSEREQKSI